MRIDEIAIDCVHEIWRRTFSGSRRDSRYFRHVATLSGREGRESKERKDTTPREGNNKSYHLAFFRVRVFTLLSFVVIYRAV